NDGWIFGTLALVDCGGIGRNQHVELAKSVGDGSAVEKSDKFFCIKIDLSRTTGTATDAIMSASTWPGPAEGSWSMPPPIRRAALSGNAFISALTIPNGRGLRGGSNQRAPRKTGVLPLANHTEPMSGFPSRPPCARHRPSAAGIRKPSQ